MQYKLKRVLIGLVSVAALPIAVACSSHEKVTESTTYVPTPASPQVVVQPVSPPAVTVVTPSTTATTTEERSMNSSDMGGNTGTAESTTSYRSESTTVTPSAPTETSSTYEKKVYKSNY